MTNPLADTLNAAAAASQADASQVAKPIEQAAAPAATQDYVAAGLPATQQTTAVAHNSPASPMSMDSSEIQNESAITSFLKLTEGGVEVSDTKYGPIKVALRIEDASQGGGFRPARMMNYEGAQGMVYTKTYDHVNTVSNSPAHAALSWAASCEKVLQNNDKAYDFLGYDLALVVVEDTQPLKGSEVLPAGTVLGFTTPYTASKTFLAIWKAAVAANQRGNDVLLELEGEEVSKNNRKYKVLRVKTLGYEAPKVYTSAITDEAAE